MSKNFPMSWEHWKGGVEAMYQISEQLERRVEAGETLSEEDRLLLERGKEITGRYYRSGRKKKPQR